MVSKLFGILALVVIAAAGFSAYSLGFGPASGSSTTSTHTTAVTCTTTSIGGSTSLRGTYNSSSSSPLRVDSVQASVSTASNGSKTVGFEVNFTNVGTSPIYVVRGCGSSLSSTIIQGGGIIKSVNVVRCLCAQGPSEVPPGQNATLVNPGCWSGYSYRIVSAGTFVVKLTISWSGSSAFSQPENTTTTATFTLD